jgi:hypothetical protein
MIHKVGILPSFVIQSVESLGGATHSAGHSNSWRWMVNLWDRMYRGAPFWTAIGTMALAGVTYKLVRETMNQGKRNHEANQRSYDLTLHQINLQYRASVYNGVIQFMANTRIWLTNRLDSLRLHLAEPTHPLLQASRELNSEELNTFVALELHGSNEALVANSIWNDKVESCSDLFDKLIDRDVNRDFNIRSDPSETSRVELLNSIDLQLSELYSLEKAFLDRAKAEVRLEPKE